MRSRNPEKEHDSDSDKSTSAYKRYPPYSSAPQECRQHQQQPPAELASQGGGDQPEIKASLTICTIGGAKLK
jgi:hypothetical protein